ncbi:MAG: hypothetical protein COU32_01085 [Candidatus Magasanikbacteria bacterium CG10_big_fil_rev_8_21_14_0_10_42_10]|uniref:Uncharacterized protein n=1 Tax=Candidatus Magasanikbacteria bacterium CG10_big_fil_rev_8_21_14_0_10_42_10 TaxID=1974649 RepID=A0A2H0TWY1_9BACT|nr:MAG: hypothetical protein COU32_01085 [Candidatus Magasanikbacteria bacterium CG10_big_fil_rev_8_21_14_0_10_42_10]
MTADKTLTNARGLVTAAGGWEEIARRSAELRAQRAKAKADAAKAAKPTGTATVKATVRAPQP